jgi:hypothetical protein
MGQQIGALDTLYNYLSPAKEGDRFRLDLVSFTSPSPPKGGGFPKRFLETDISNERIKTETMTIREDIIKNNLNSLIGKTVYVMFDDKIVIETIQSIDEYQLFCKKYIIQMDKQFFYSMEELIDYLIKTKAEI